MGSRSGGATRRAPGVDWRFMLRTLTTAPVGRRRSATPATRATRPWPRSRPAAPAIADTYAPSASAQADLPARSTLRALRVHHARRHRPGGALAGWPPCRPRSIATPLAMTTTPATRVALRPSSVGAGAATASAGSADPDQDPRASANSPIRRATHGVGRAGKAVSPRNHLPTAIRKLKRRTRSRRKGSAPCAVAGHTAWCGVGAVSLKVVRSPRARRKLSRRPGGHGPNFAHNQGGLPCGDS